MKKLRILRDPNFQQTETIFTYLFHYKDAKGIMQNECIYTNKEDNELAIAHFEKLFPDIVWREFQKIS